MFDKRPDIAAVYSFNITKATADILVTIDDDRSCPMSSPAYDDRSCPTRSQGITTILPH